MMRRSIAFQSLWLLSGLWNQGTGVAAIELDINDEKSILAANSIACDNALTYYKGDEPGHTPGIPEKPYYWWEAGGLFGTLIQRWSITGNSSLNKMITEGMQAQVGEHLNYEPADQSADLGNDDQAFWAFAAMDAAEMGFPNPPADQPSWTALAQAVFNRQYQRWDPLVCGGGLRWQIVPVNAGFDYKNTMTNGGLFQLSARLARYTGNNTYAEHAEKMYDWVVSSALFDNSTNPVAVWDGVHIANCSGPTKLYWTYNPATLLVGAAYMYNYTDGAPIWEQRINTLMGAMNVHFVKSAGLNNPVKPAPPGGDIMSEVACEFNAPQTCDQDEPSFKAYSMRWYAMTMVLAPFTRGVIFPRIQASAQAAAGQCTGSGPGQPAGTSCGRRWYQTTWDGFTGLGEHMSAMSVFQSLLIDKAPAPFTLKSGGKSQGDASAGAAGAPNDPNDDPQYSRPMTAADKAGAGILTILGAALPVLAASWMTLERFDR